MFDRIGFRTSGLKHLPLKTVFEGFVQAGFQTVEFCLEHPEASPVTLELARNNGLEISSISYHGKKDDLTTRLKYGKRAVRMATEYSVEVVVLGSPLMNREGFLRETAELYEICLDLGIKPAWETEPGTVLNGVDEFNRYIACLGPLAGINLDAGHLHIQGRCTVGDIKALGDRIFHVHVEGMNRSEHIHLIPGQGDMNWKELFRGLAETGYGGSLTIDLFKIPADWKEYIQRANIALKTLIRYYRSNQTVFREGDL